VDNELLGKKRLLFNQRGTNIILCQEKPLLTKAASPIYDIHDVHPTLIFFGKILEKI
jgi:hypothetical protein